MHFQIILVCTDAEQCLLFRMNALLLALCTIGSFAAVPLFVQRRITSSMWVWTSKTIKKNAAKIDFSSPISLADLLLPM
jgi:hypothetical protein